MSTTGLHVDLATGNALCHYTASPCRWRQRRIGGCWRDIPFCSGSSISARRRSLDDMDDAARPIRAGSQVWQASGASAKDAQQARSFRLRCCFSCLAFENRGSPGRQIRFASSIWMLFLYVHDMCLTKWLIIV
jgi:hypothetical protein